MKTRGTLFTAAKVGILLLMLFNAFPALANPIPFPERPVTGPLTFSVTVAIFIEAICWTLCLRRFCRPRLFILWVLGMHLITFPAFVGLMHFLDTLRPAVAVTLGELFVVIAEGFLVFLACNYLARASQTAPAPGLLRCWVVSLLGNACSMVVFPFLTAASDRFGW
jgi:hypothetical protein